MNSTEGLTKPSYRSVVTPNRALLVQAVELAEEKLRRQIDRRCASDALYWLQNHTATENPKHAIQGREFVAPFPRKSYFVPLFEHFAKCPRLLVPKSREMLTSWSVMGWATNRAQWHKWEVIVQTESENKAAELVDYAAQLYRHQPDWLKTRHPLEREPGAYEAVWKDGGRVMSIPKGANKIRMYHPTLYVMDEAAFLPEAQECYNVASPVAQQIIAISSAGPSWLGDQCSR